MGGATSSDCVIRRVAGEMTLGKAKSEGPELKVLYVRILVSNIQNEPEIAEMTMLT